MERVVGQQFVSSFTSFARSNHEMRFIELSSFLFISDGAIDFKIDDGMTLLSKDVEGGEGTSQRTLKDCSQVEHDLG